MNIEPLYELKERLNVSAVAGISLMSEDFRLKRAIEQMEPLAKKVPVFMKIYQGALKILEVSAKERADALLDELALLDAVLVTQAAAGMEGELLPINEGLNETVYTDAPYSKIATVLEALTTSGSGHYSFIMQMHEENPEMFKDFRLKEALVNGLGAGYIELADTVEQWLSKEDASFLPFLKKGFQPNGKKEMIRRIHVIEGIAGAEENDWYLSMLELAQKEVKEALIYALRHDRKNEELLFNLVKTEKGKGKKAAIWALTRMESPLIYEFFKEQLKKKSNTINMVWKERYFCSSKSDELSDLLADEINNELDLLEEQVARGNNLLSSEECEKINLMFNAMPGKSSEKIINVYRRLAATKVFYGMKEAENKKKPISFWDRNHSYGGLRYVGQQFELRYVAGILTDSILMTKDAKLCELAYECYRKYHEAFLKPALIVALLTKDGDEVFSEFSHYLVPNGEKESEEKRAGRHAIMDTFAMLWYDGVSDQYVCSKMFFDEYLEKNYEINEKIYGEFDIRWIELLTSQKIKKDGSFQKCHSHSKIYEGTAATWDSVLDSLIRPNDSRNCELLGKYFYDRSLYSKMNPGVCYDAIERCHYKLERGVVIQHFKKTKKLHFWGLEYLIERAPMTDEDKRAELNEISELVDKKELKIEGWTEERYLDLLRKI